MLKEYHVHAPAKISVFLDFESADRLLLPTVRAILAESPII